MIHDKDYIIRIVKQFSEFVSKMILGGKNEGDLVELQRVFDTNMNDTFKMDFETLASKPTEEIIEIIHAKEKIIIFLISNCWDIYFTLKIKSVRILILPKSQSFL